MMHGQKTNTNKRRFIILENRMERIESEVDKRNRQLDIVILIGVIVVIAEIIMTVKGM